MLATEKELYICFDAIGNTYHRLGSEPLSRLLRGLATSPASELVAVPRSGSSYRWTDCVGRSPNEWTCWIRQTKIHFRAPRCGDSEFASDWCIDLMSCIDFPGQRLRGTEMAAQHFNICNDDFVPRIVSVPRWYHLCITESRESVVVLWKVHCTAGCGG